MSLEHVELANELTTRQIDHLTSPSAKWHVLWVRSHCEQMVTDQLSARGFHPFLPMIEVWKRSNGIRQRYSVPMFPGYLFLHHAMDSASYLEACQARGIVKFLGERWNRLAVIPDQEIEAIRKIHESRLPALLHPYLREGQRVRITQGLLADVEGILLRIKPNKGLLVVSVNLLQRSVAVETDCALVAPV